MVTKWSSNYVFYKSSIKIRDLNVNKCKYRRKQLPTNSQRTLYIHTRIKDYLWLVSVISCCKTISGVKCKVLCKFSDFLNTLRCQIPYVKNRCLKSLKKIMWPGVLQGGQHFSGISKLHMFFYKVGFKYFLLYALIYLVSLQIIKIIEWQIHLRFRIVGGNILPQSDLAD